MKITLDQFWAIISNASYGIRIDESIITYPSLNEDWEDFSFMTCEWDQDYSTFELFFDADDNQEIKFDPLDGSFSLKALSLSDYVKVQILDVKNDFDFS